MPRIGKFHHEYKPGGEYNDNILFSDKGQELDDYIFFMKPSVEAKYGTRRFSLGATAALITENYADYTALDTVDQDYRLTLAYAFSQTFNVRTRGYYIKDTTQDTERAEEGLRVDRDDRKRFAGGIGFDYAFSPVFGINGDWEHIWHRYETLYDDRQIDEVTLAPYYQMSPKTRVFLDLGYKYTQYDRPGDPSIDNYRIRPSFRHNFAEDWYIEGRAGYRSTKNKTVSPEETSDGFDFLLDYHKVWKRAVIDLIASRDQYSSVDETSVERTRFTIRGTYRWSERLSTGLSGTYRFNRPDQGTDDYDYFLINPSMNYTLTPTATLRASVDYSEYNYDVDSNRDSDRFRAQLTVNLGWPRLWSGK